jgi:hypothetical protein
MNGQTSARKAAAIAFPIIVVVVSALFALSYLISTLLVLPYSLNLPMAARLAGGAIILAGLMVMGWTFWIELE